MFQVITGVVMLYKLLPDGRRQIVEVLGDGDVFGFCARPPCAIARPRTSAATNCTAL